MSVVVEFPDALLLAAREEPESFRREVVIHTLGRLYAAGKISASIGMEALDCDRATFFHLIAERGYAVIELAEDELDDESASVERLRASREG